MENSALANRSQDVLAEGIQAEGWYGLAGGDTNGLHLSEDRREPKE
ncbi:MAG: hypothetical protein OXI57_04415 [Rhodospirillales bacterium]|nr:hypothetical protein [Rhodospirillales bacterium]